eukprot:1740181-Amphidinium_carterae.1
MASTLVKGVLPDAEPIPPGSDVLKEGAERYNLLHAQQKKKRDPWQYSGPQARLRGRYSGPHLDFLLLELATLLLYGSRKSCTFRPNLSGDHSQDTAITHVKPHSDADQ